MNRAISAWRLPWPCRLGLKQHRRTVSTDAAVSAWVQEQLSSKDSAHYVPEVDPVAKARLAADGEALAQFLLSHRRVVALTGAGCSTASGTPDYRSPRGSYSRGHKPVTFQKFVASHSNRQRYWARGLFGWPLMASVKPNVCHSSLAALERLHIVHSIITQNVDKLHHRAGSRNVTELHGSMAEVVCLSCREVSSRAVFQTELEKRNQQYVRAVIDGKRTMIGAKADGDADFGFEDYSSFEVPYCSACGEEKGIMKPNVVFFGENLDAEVKRNARTAVEEADALVVVGSSLQVPSAYRLFDAVQTKGLSTMVVNVGPTKADSVEGVQRIHQEAGSVLASALRTIMTCH